MTTHKAYRLHAYGGPETLTLDDVPIPTPGPGQVQVAVHTVAMNPFDWKLREGHVRDFVPLQLPTVLGVDFVGTVAALGDGVQRFRAGERVMSFSTRLGAFAEHIVVDETILTRVPAALSDVDAATLPIPATTAWQSLLAAGAVRPGMKILIHGASGTVGAFAIQFAKAEGAHVIGTASGKNREYVLGLGADEFVDYQTQDFEKVVKDVDLVLDYVLVGGVKNTTSRSWGVLKSGGAIVSVADPSITAQVPQGFKGFFPDIQPEPKQLEAVALDLATGRIQSKVARVFKRGELVEAMEINKAGGLTGRLIVDFKKA